MIIERLAFDRSGSTGRPGMPILGAHARRQAMRAARARVAIMVPMSGSAGIWGPSCISCAQLAIAEINRGSGLGGREVDPIYLDADDSAIDQSIDVLMQLLEDGGVSAIVGMHVSSVRQKLNAVLGGRIPYVYTPLYEGGESAPGCFAIGETPSEQLAPAIRRLTEMFGARRWALVGNDYVWPRVSHALAKRYMAPTSGQVVFEEYVPFGTEEPYELVERLAAAKPDAILLSLVGQDAVEFNRVFGAMDLDRSIVRLSTAIEENVLLATGAQGTKRLFGASSYFAGLRTQANLSFAERYHTLHAGRGPVLNALGQSMYEGMHFLAALGGSASGRPAPLKYRSARGGVFVSNRDKHLPIYLARADGHQFSVLERLS